MADVDSVVNVNTVTDLDSVDFILYPDSVLNVNTVTEPSVTLILKPNSVVNQNTVTAHSVKLILKPDSVVNQNTVTPIFKANPGLSVRSVNTILNVSTVSEVSAGDQIQLTSVANQNIVSPLSIPGLRVLGPNTITSVNTFGFVIAKANQPDSDIVAPTNPVSRPTLNQISPSERLLDAQLGEKVSIFKDLSLSFKAHPLTGEPVRVLNENSINQAFKNIILTDKKERPFSNIKFGANIRAKLFEVMTPTVERDIKETLQREILNVDNRVIIKNISLNRVDTYGIHIKIDYKIRTFEQASVFEMFLERI